MNLDDNYITANYYFEPENIKEQNSISSDSSTYDDSSSDDSSSDDDGILLLVSEKNLTPFKCIN